MIWTLFLVNCCLAVFSYYVDCIDVLFLDLMDGGRSDCWEMLGASEDTNNCTSIYTASTFADIARLQLHE